MTIREFLRLEAVAGLCLILATIVALIFANTKFSPYYAKFLDTIVFIGIQDLGELRKPFLLWINDGLMAIFFFLVGLELKREFLIGHLANLRQAALSGFGAIGGIIAPGLIYYLLNSDSEVKSIGWAIPTATDIAFAIGVLSLCGSKVPYWAKIYLLSLAIFDDLIAITIIAVFYTDSISLMALLFGTIFMLIMLLLNRSKVISLTPYILCGIALWLCVLKSGIHATLSGVITASLIPLSKNTNHVEHDLHPWVAYLILPLFAFANTGLDIDQIIEVGLDNTVTMGCLLGLFVGKQVGIFLATAIPIILFNVPKPKDFSYLMLYGLSIMGGIGFTMSLFISALAFGEDPEMLVYMIEARAGVLLGSVASAILGFIVTKKSISNMRITHKVTNIKPHVAHDHHHKN